MSFPTHSLAARRCRAVVADNSPASTGLIRLGVECDQELDFLPGQFVMVNLSGPRRRTFGRPFSILSCRGTRVELLYRVVGGGTRDLSTLEAGDELSLLGPLGRPFPDPEAGRPVVLVAGGVGLPPVLAWWHRHARPEDQGYFGARDAGDMPWELVPESWHLSADVVGDHSEMPAGRTLWQGLVTELATRRLPGNDGSPGRILACGPLPLLEAVGNLAAERGWDCFVSMEEHMGCGYGACKGCVLPVRDEGGLPEPWRNATCCQEGPVFAAEEILWSRLR